MHKRYHILDDIRGLAILNMVAYHAVWDLVYLFGLDWPWFQGAAAALWQQGICWTFIALSGFCLPLSRRRAKRSLLVFGAGVLVSVVTAIAMPQNRILFGVLTLMGSAMLLLLPLERWLRRCPPALGVVLSMAAFLLTKEVPAGRLGLGGWSLALPRALYCSSATAFLGFPPPGFSSSDYFPLLPWLFLFVAGYFLYHTLQGHKGLRWLEHKGLGPLEWAGRHSLVIYLLHQPVIYAVLSLLF